MDEFCEICEDILYDGVCLSCEGEVFSFGPEHYEERPLTPHEEQQAMVEFAKNSRVHGEMSWEVECEGKTLLVEDVSDCDSFQRNALRTSAHRLIDTENNIWVFVRSY